MLDQLMNSIPTAQLAQAVGEDEATTRAAVQAALPALLGGLSANANNPAGAQSLLGALDQHQAGLADDIQLDAIDANDGEKILGHVFGGNTDAVVNQLGGLGGAQTGSLVRKLLPLLAPIVLSWLAKQVGGAMSGQAAPQGGPTGGTPTTSQPGGPLGQGRPEPTTSSSATSQGGVDPTSVLQDVLGGALGGVTGRQPSSGGGSILGDVLGSILGGGRR